MNHTAVTDIQSTEVEAKDALVVFTPSGKRGSFAKGTTILEAARALGVDLELTTLSMECRSG